MKGIFPKKKREIDCYHKSSLVKTEKGSAKVTVTTAGPVETDRNVRHESPFLTLTFTIDKTKRSCSHT